MAVKKKEIKIEEDEDDVLIELPEPKPKRKYTRKVKINLETAPTPAQSPALPLILTPTLLPTEEIIDKLLGDVYISPYKEIGVYIYYQGNANVNVLTFIKSFQVILDSKKLGSQVQIVSTRGVEKSGIRNCYTCETVPNKWTDFIMTTSPVLAVRVKELPRISPEELYELILVETDFENDFFVIKESC